MGSTGLISILGRAVLETLAMVGISVIVAQAVGTPLGILLVVTEEGHILPNRWVNRSLGTIINIGRSIPFIILLVAVLPFTRFLVGTTIGTNGMIVPLTVAAIPFVARVVESALK
ncbi:MAG: methionine ABC transporter permease, partial [Limnochordia bacterium]